jgi:hypothetical protein
MLHERASLLPYTYVASHVVINIYYNMTSFRSPPDSESIVIQMYIFDSAELSRVETWVYYF